jgi:hypothetical protein
VDQIKTRNESTTWFKSVATKTEEGSIKVARHLVASEDKFAVTGTIAALSTKYLPAPLGRRLLPAPAKFAALQVLDFVIMDVMKSFPPGSAGCFDGI